MKQIANYAGFQIGWFLLVLSQSPWALAWALGFAAMHSLWFARPGEWERVAGIMVFGVMVDTLWQQTPWVQFEGSGWPIPLWLTGLWLTFPLTLNHSLLWLRGRFWLQVVFGVIGGGGSYLAGAKLGAANLSGPAYFMLPLSWGIWLPAFYAWNDFATKTTKTG